MPEMQPYFYVRDYWGTYCLFKMKRFLVDALGHGTIRVQKKVSGGILN